MQTPDQLFALIHSLKKEEKRHFKLYAKKYGKASNYLLLFDVLVRAKEYNEERLRSALSGAHFTERLSVAKEYLFTLILRSLRDMEPQTPQARVIKLTEDGAQLLDRRLFVAAKKRLAKASELAAHYDLSGEQLMISELEGYLPMNDRDEITEQGVRILKQINEIAELSHFAEELRKFKEAKGWIRTEADAQELGNIIKLSPPGPEALMTFSARMRYFFGWFKYYEIVGEDVGIINMLRAIVHLYDEHPQHVHTQQLAYVTILMNLSARELEQGERTNYPKYLQRVIELEASQQIKPYCELMLFRFALLEAIADKNWKTLDKLQHQLPSLLDEFAAEANSYGKDIRIDYYLNFAKGYFLQGAFGKALIFVTALLQLPTLKDYPYQENNVRVLLLILHYELDNISYLPHLIRSTYRAILRRDLLFEFEACVLRYLGSLSRLKRKKDILPSFEKLLSEINLLSQQPIDREFPWRTFYTDWLREKITNLKLNP